MGVCQDTSNRAPPFGYYGAFYRSELDFLADRIDEPLVRWAMHKFKRLGGRPMRAWARLNAVRQREPRLCAHWHLLPLPTAGLREPYDGRPPRTVLREPGGEIPPRLLLT